MDRRDKRTQVEQNARPAVDARCVAKVFYKQSELDEIDVHLVVSLDEENQNKYVDEWYASERWTKSNDSWKVFSKRERSSFIEIEEQDYDSWRLYSLHSPNNITLDDVLYFKPHKTIPHCAFGLRLLAGKRPGDRIFLKVKINGDSDTDFFHVRYKLPDVNPSLPIGTTTHTLPDIPEVDRSSTSSSSTEENVLHVNPSATSQLCCGKSTSTQEYNTQICEESSTEASSTLMESVSGSSRRCSQLIVGTTYLKADDCRHFYPMDRDPHGLAMIFRVQSFSHNRHRPNLKLEERLGADKDMERYAEAFQAAGYEALKRTDFTADDILKEVRKIASSYSKDYDSLVICFTTHGEDNYYVFGSDSASVFVYKLSALMRECAVLKGKPILMFLQCCRTPAQDQAANPKPCPAGFQPDVFIAWATSHFCKAYRSTTYGSWFPKALCDVFKESAHHHDLHTMMHEVNRRVCEMEGEDGEQQCVQLEDHLRYNVSFYQSL